MTVIAKNNAVVIDRCPHCGVANPALQHFGGYREAATFGAGRYQWWFFQCRSCCAPIAFKTHDGDANNIVQGQFPKLATPQVADELPSRAKHHLLEAVRGVGAGLASASLVACAASVDAMLRGLGYKEGSLYSRIAAAQKDHVITDGMAKWAHHVRLEANDQRHDDENAPLPTAADAIRCIEFVEALGELLYVLPAKVTKGLGTASPAPST